MSAVYEMLGATGHLGKTQELFTKLDANADGSVTQVLCCTGVQNRF